jgi:lipopolysaccharide biosynthesis glycosyltransferase
MLTSLFVNNPENKFQIHLFIDFDENRELQKLISHIGSFKQLVNVIYLDASAVDNLKITGHVSKATYFRLLIPEYLEKFTDKVIYLDSDLLVFENLLPLWEISLHEFPVAGVEEISFIREGIDYKVFNAGVLLLDIRYWNQNCLTEKALDFARNNFDKITYWDQDVLNYIFRQNWLALSEKWNITSGYFELKSNIAEISIVHFTGSLKPWHYHCQHPLKKEYFNYLRKTPWKNFGFPEDTLQHRLKQNLKKGINFLAGRKIFEIYA